eukprot:GHVU01114412.1.p1 GENE.GHVU01114412.1~~GHVU01114412.1.p1  ORF type:complete len:143 (+),score=15.43 GHVU01114412.1:41-469(+)
MARQLAAFTEKLGHFRQVIKQNGGIVGSYLKIWRTEELKFGKLVGTDKFGNEYYENKLYFIGRSRWVEYTPAVGMDYDASQVPAEWHRWLHYIGDENPVDNPPTRREWMINRNENLTGTKDEYVPYSTTKPKIHAWVPPKNQ